EKLRIFGAKNNFHQLMDRVARLYPGTLEPTSTYTYNKQGHLLEETVYETRTTYQRDPETGLLLTEKEIHSDNSGHLLVLHYNSKGLLEKTISYNLDGTPSENTYYHYTFY
ncbi:MAG: hypothetical protein LPK19_12465, partial [Hymenobacteraceae bacterium]|nr:hypothetical protein [Hymenobacteraceae bacterium]MDX5397041.1 hypothetical protein [Hymenobacteraceae bacterium]MDX5513111.1 hypothetical protein [Hymenobacteraceae bacterium]